MSTYNINTYSLSICDEVTQICQPLFKHTPIKAFLYSRVFPDGSRAEVGSHLEHLELTFIKTRHMHRVDTTRLLNGAKRIYVPDWIAAQDNPNLTKQMHNQASLLNLGNEYCIIFQSVEYYEFFHFYAAANDETVINFYLDNTDLLDHFSQYFCHKAAHLIKKATTNRILKTWRSSTTLKLSADKKKFTGFWEETKLDKLYIDDTLTNYLTPREVQCARYLLDNQSASDIARDLNLSSRTVENYLSSIKDKLICNKKSELLAKLSELNLHYLTV